MNKENCLGLAETILGGLNQFNFFETSPLSSEAAPDIEHKNKNTWQHKQKVQNWIPKTLYPDKNYLLISPFIWSYGWLDTWNENSTNTSSLGPITHKQR